MGKPAVPAATLRLQALSGSFELGKSMAEGLAVRHAVPRALFPSHSLVSPGLDFTPEAEDVPRSGCSTCLHTLPAPSRHRTYTQGAPPGRGPGEWLALDSKEGFPGGHPSISAYINWQCLWFYSGLNDEFTNLWRVCLYSTVI